MRFDPDNYRNRMEMAWRNVRANRSIRPADMLNGFRMMHPFKSLSQPMASREMAKLAVEVFTRLQVKYQPYQGESCAQTHRVASQHNRNDQPRVGLFVDAPDHMSGVALTLADWATQARRFGFDFTIHTCSNQLPDHRAVTFPPMGSIKLDAYPDLTLHMPRMDDILHYISTMPIDVVHVSTPGPMGMLGILAARQRGLPLCGTYHTDFPRYAGVLTGDVEMEQLGWKFMRWFYGQCNRIAVPTETMRRELSAHGFDDTRMNIVGRGVDTTSFNPKFRCTEWRNQWGGRFPLKLLYVGRMSREKNLETLAKAFRLLLPSRPDICLIMVGDGPYRAELEQSMNGLPVFFTGTLKGQALATTYASCDLFVFPSKTDTFGRVILEAQASGLPVVVSDEGGPRDVMINNQTGVVVPGLCAENLAAAIDSLTDHPSRMAQFRDAARRHAARHTPEASFNAFWNLHTFDNSKHTLSKHEVMI